MTPRFDPVPTPVLRDRQRAVAGALQEGCLILPGTPVVHRSRDTEYPYRPDSELYWLTGLTVPDAVAVMEGGREGGELSLFLPGRDPEAELWTGPRMDPDEARERTGAETIHTLDELEERLPGFLDRFPTLFFRLGAHPRVEPLVVRALRRARSRGQRKGGGPRRVVDPGEVLDDLRLVKDAYEVARIRDAARITMAAFRELEDALEPGVPEWRLQAVLEAVFRGEGGDGPAYGTIVGSGPNACVLHYGSNERVVQPGELVLVDAGAAVGLYAADISRTYAADGTLTPAQETLHGLVDGARKAAVAVVRPGATVAAVHEAAVRHLTEGLAALGLLQGSVDELVEEEAYKPFFPHQTSHWLGLDVHDVGDYATEGRARVLEPGMVLTVEPGLYMGPAALEVAGAAADPFAGMGVRIEDDILVTESGQENLTGELPTAVPGP